MTDKNLAPFDGNFSNVLFDESFLPLSFFNSQEKLLGIDVGVQKGIGNYVLTIATAELYAKRAEENTSDDDIVLVLSNEEILPSDLLAIKQSVLETDSYDDYLVIQTDD